MMTLKRSISNVSGFWGGVYFYPENISEPVNFDTELSQQGYDISGAMTEINTIDPEGGVILASVIDGRLESGRITFIKRYTNGAEKHDVTYQGTVSDDFMEISGQWSILSLSGTFVMSRDSGKTIELPVKRAQVDNKEFVQ